MGQKTPLYDQHLAAGGKLVDFGGWDMPINYGSQIDEHHRVRQNSGLFDVSHMTLVDITGAQARGFLQTLLANDVARLDGQPGKALYSVMLNERGGVIDDLIVYNLQGTELPCDYRAVVNCATRDKDLAWMRSVAEAFEVSIDERSDLAMLAIQGPKALEQFTRVVPLAGQDPGQLKPFASLSAGDWLIARTGYTGEDGLEVILPAAEAPSLWERLLAAGAAPCGLGARDTLRLEAGLNLYGQEMDEDTSPLEANLGWTIAREHAGRAFIGREALERDTPSHKLVGLMLDERGIMRAGQTVHLPDSERTGRVTSGSFSPTLGRAIALARVPADIGTQCQVAVRNRRLDARVVKPAFVRRGRPINNLD